MPQRPCLPRPPWMLWCLSAGQAKLSSVSNRMGPANSPLTKTALHFFGSTPLFRQAVPPPRGRPRGTPLPSPSCCLSSGTTPASTLTQLRLHVCGHKAAATARDVGQVALQVGPRLGRHGGDVRRLGAGGQRLGALQGRPRSAGGSAYPFEGQGPGGARGAGSATARLCSQAANASSRLRACTAMPRPTCLAAQHAARLRQEADVLRLHH